MQRDLNDFETGPHLLAGLRARREEMLRLLARFVRAESPTDSKAAVDRFGGIVASEWRKLRAEVRVLRQSRQGNHIRVKWPASGAKGRQILVLGHLDTVYALGALAHMPFRAANGRAFGPGIFDMKGGLVIALFAAGALARAKRVPHRPVTFLWTSDEETGSRTSRALIEREARRSVAALVLEPASGLDGRLKTERKAVGTAVLTVSGRASHAGVNPAGGINAIHELALQIERIAPLNNSKRGITVSPTVIEGGTRGNVIPAGARLTLDLRARRATYMRAVERSLQ